MAQPQTLRRVLVLDDDQIMRDLLALMLDGDSYAVTFATSGEEALDALRQNAAAFDVVLTDLHMPGLHGGALVERLRAAIVSNCALVGMSGTRPAPEELAAFHSFLQKPFTLKQLYAAVQYRVDGDPPSTATASAVPSPAAPQILDEATFGKLAAMMPLAQLRELYRVTLHDVQRRLSRMAEAAARGEVAAYCSEAHSIKGGCGMVGAAELCALAARAENDPTASPAIFQEFASACARLQSMLEARIGA